MRVYGVSMVRNEADIVRLSILHHLSLGLDRILVVDNGSSDGTDEVLRELSKDSRVRWTRDTGAYRQAEIVTGLAREAFREGADWIVPFDADEFWYAPFRDFRRILEESTAGALRAQVVQFVQRREQKVASPDALRHMTRRVSKPLGPKTAGRRKLVESQRIAYVEMWYPPKLISRSSPAVKILKGNHFVQGVNGPVLDTAEIFCLHAPLRSRATLEAKVKVGERSEEAGRKPGQSWHLARWQRLRAEGRLDQEWAANSYRHGYLDVYGVPHPVIFDPTLRDLITPFL